MQNIENSLQTGSLNKNFKFRYKTPLLDAYKRVINDPKEPKFEYLLIDVDNGKQVRFSDVDAIKNKRNKMIDFFFEVYDNDKYTLIESSFPDSGSFPLTRVIQSIKQKCNYMGSLVLGYIWVIDVGKNNNRHFHLVVAYPRVDVKNKHLPNFLKYRFRQVKIYSSFINNVPAFKYYLKKKKVFERGYRKKTFNKSIKYITL